MTEPLEFLQDVSKLELRRGDVLVFRTKLLLDKDQIAAIKARIDYAIGDVISEIGVKVIVLTGDFDIAVLRKEASQC
jgi:hypothetical protein